MCCRLVEMREKQVVCIKDGTILGLVGDVEVDTCNGCLKHIIVFGRKKCFGLFGRETDYRIPWESIQVIGEDSILVDFSATAPRAKRKNLLSQIFFSN